MKDKHIIWGDINLNFEDWKADLQEQYPDKTEDELYQIMHETNSEYIGDELMNLNIQLDRSIIIVADLGLWNGRFMGYKELSSGNISDCLYSNADMNEWYVDKNGDFRCTAIHHDGTNSYLYRTYKENTTDEQIERLKDKLYNGTAIRSDITRITERLGDKIGGGMYIILPKDGDANALLSNMTNDYFNEIQNDLISATGKLLLPRFEIQSDVMDLKQILMDMGVPLFDEESAPLTGGLIEQDIPVWLSSAVQKAMIKVDEKGTTAAAVTVMAAAGAAMPTPTEPFVMNCNKPFVFVLYGNTYDGGNQILFTGMVNNP